MEADDTLKIGALFGETGDDAIPIVAVERMHAHRERAVDLIPMMNEALIVEAGLFAEEAQLAGAGGVFAYGPGLLIIKREIGRDLIGVELKTRIADARKERLDLAALAPIDGEHPGKDNASIARCIKGHRPFDLSLDGELFEATQAQKERAKLAVDKLGGGGMIELCGAKDRDKKSGHGSEIRDIKRGIRRDDPAIDGEHASGDISARV